MHFFSICSMCKSIFRYFITVFHIPLLDWICIIRKWTSVNEMEASYLCLIVPLLTKLEQERKNIWHTTKYPNLQLHLDYSCSCNYWVLNFHTNSAPRRGWPEDAILLPLRTTRAYLCYRQPGGSWRQDCNSELPSNPKNQHSHTRTGLQQYCGTFSLCVLHLGSAPKPDLAQKHIQWWIDNSDWKSSYYQLSKKQGLGVWIVNTQNWILLFQITNMN